MTYLFFLTLAPLVLFVIIDAYYGLKTGVLSALVTGTIATGFFFWIKGEFDWSATIVLLLLGLTGYVSIRLNDSFYFKLQPFITGTFTALFLAYFQFFDQPLFVKLLPKIQDIMPSEMQSQLDNPVYLQMMGELNLHIIIWTLAHAMIMGWAALKWSNKFWISAKVLNIPFVVLMSFLSYSVF